MKLITQVKCHSTTFRGSCLGAGRGAKAKETHTIDLLLFSQEVRHQIFGTDNAL